MSNNYEFIPKTKKKIKITIEKIPYLKKKKIPRKSYEEQLYAAAEEAKERIMTDKALLGTKMVNKRTESVFNNPDFEIIKKCGEKIRHREVLYYLLFAGAFVFYSVLITLLSFAFGFPILMLSIIPVFVVCRTIIRPKVRFKKLFNEIYLPICYVCASIRNEHDTLSFEIYDSKKNWDKKTPNKKIITNCFKIKTKSYDTNVEKMIVRNWITTYKMKNGEITVGKKMATIFSGYSFEIKYPMLTNKYAPDTILGAIINKNTFLGTDGIYMEDAALLKTEKIRDKFIDDNWEFYLRNGVKIESRYFKELKKKIVMIKNEIGPFNAYITPNGIRMMISVQLNRDGLKEEFFQAQLKNPESLTYNGFFSIIKTLYVVNCMNRLTKCFFGLNEKNFKKIICPNNTENKRNSLFAVKKGEIAINTAIKVAISVILGSLLIVGFTSLLDNTVSPGIINNTDKVYSEENYSSVITETLLEN